MNDSDIKARLNTAIDAQLAGRTAPPFSPPSPSHHTNRQPGTVTRWMLPALAALVIGAVTIGFVLALRSNTPVEPAHPTPTPTARSVAPPPVAPSTSAAISHATSPTPATVTTATPRPTPQCPTAQQMLAIITTTVGGGPYKIFEPGTTGYQCQDGWAYILFNNATPPTDRPNNVQSRDLRFANNQWQIVSEQTACGDNLNGPMPEVLKHGGGCGG